jgi:two-component system response regulator FixJ
LVDDDDAVRDSLSELLTIAGYPVVSFASGQEFLDRAPSLPPGCAIVDFQMPGLDGITVQRALADAHLNFPTIILTGHGDIPTAVSAMKAGVVDFVEKPVGKEAILASIAQALSRFAGKPDGDPGSAATAARLKLLSSREQEVLEGVVAGLSNKMIASRLSLSPRTVEIHRARLMDKMQAQNLSELIRLALAAGIAPAEPHARDAQLR